MKIKELLRPILAEVPTGKRYRPITPWSKVEYLVVPNEVWLEPYCVTNEGKRLTCYWNRDNIAYHLERGTIIEIV